MTAFVLLPSPLVGPATWTPVAGVLAGKGHQVVVASVHDVVTAVDGLDDIVLVPHSNAGYYASSLIGSTGARAVVYVDAALPLAAGSEVALAPPDFYEFLAGLADDRGVLPPWTRWWDDLGDLFPDEATRLRVEAEQPRLPLSYFASRVPVVAGWAERPSAYLAFGQTYAEEISWAYEHAWPVVEMAGNHLHQLHEPEVVADAIVALATCVRP